MNLSDISFRGADPWVIKVDDGYYYSYSLLTGIYVYKTKSLKKLKQKGKLVYQVKKGINAWAPEIHFIDNKWYIYYAVPKSNKEDRRMYALSSNNPFGPYKLEGQITDSSDKWAIDGTVLDWNNNLYFIWSGWENDENVRQNLYIAHMKDPITIDSERVMISTPEYDWEKVGSPKVNEGPEALIRNDNLYIIYSASGSWTDAYCLGLLKFIGEDLLNPNSWLKYEKPIFKSNDNIIGPGHASFVKDDDDKTNIIIYHSFLNKKSISWDKRMVRMQKFEWNEDMSYIKIL